MSWRLKFMKRTVLFVAVCTFVAVPVLADTVTTTGSNTNPSGYQGFGPYQTGVGGEFTLAPSAGLQWVLQYYSSSTKNQNSDGITPSFQSFCLEGGEYISPDTTYVAVRNGWAIMGGNPPAGDPLSKGTAWLYHEFQSGTLDRYNYTGDRHASAAALQNTIWWLEGEAADPGATNVFRNAVITQFGSAAAAMASNAGLFPVAVLNLYTESGSLAQDMLVCVPVPAAVLLGMLGLGAAGLKLRRFA
jgi:hypothetical protein